MDSILQKEFQSGFRTSHGFGVRVSPKRIYWMSTSAIVAYDTGSFFSRLSPTGEQNLIAATSIPVPGTYRATSTPDVILHWDEFFNPEGSGSWTTPLVDGVRRMWDFDWDDRGYVYMATGTFGWGLALDDYGVGNWMANGFQDLTFGATAIHAVQDGAGNYYAIVGDGSTPTSQVWSVGTKTSLQHQRQPADLAFAIRSAARATDGSNRIAIVQGGSGTLAIYNGADLVRGGNPAPVATIAVPAGGWAFASVTTDGKNFFASSNGPAGASISVIVPNANGGYDVKPPYAIGSPGWYSLQYGANTLAATDTVTNLWLFTVSSNLALQQLTQPVFQPSGTPFMFFHNFYSTAGSSIYDAVPYAYNGKTYLLVSTYTLGDVYEIVSNTTSLALSAAPSSVVYGDPVTFTLTGAGVAKPSVNLQFGDGLTQNGIVATPDYPPIPPHTYGGLNNAQLPRSFSATATSVPASSTDTPITATANVTVKAPQQVGFKILGAPELLFVQPNASAPAMIDTASKIVTGDQFVDASDGSSASHYVDWTMSGSSTKSLAATAPFPDTGVQCGSYTLTYLAHYGPNASALSITNGDAQYGVGAIVGPPTTGYSLGFTVKPLAFELKKDPGDPLGTTIAAVTRLSNNSADFLAAAPSGVSCTYHWRLLASDQSTRIQDDGVDHAATLGTVASNKFVIDPSKVQSGATYYVQLTIEIDPSAVSASCGTTLATDPATHKLFETIVMPYTATASCTPMTSQSLEADYTGSTGDCNSNFGTCSPQDIITFTVAPINGYSFSCAPYSFAWNFGDGVLVAGDTTNGRATHQFPASSQPYAVTVTVKDASGNQITIPIVRQLFVGGGSPPPPPPPTNSCPPISSQNLEADYTGSTGDCSSNYGTCSAQDIITFTVAPINGYSFSCPPYSFIWNFGNGVTATGDSLNGRTTYQFAASSQPYGVTVTVTDSAGHQTTLPLVRPLIVGGGSTPPPPTNNCPVITAQNLEADYTGSTGDCNSNYGTCSPQDIITFTVAPINGYTFMCAPYSFTWDFGNGVPVTGDPSNGRATHQFASSAQPYAVTVTVRDSAGHQTTLPLVRPLIVGGAPTCTPLTQQSFSIGYSGCTGTCMDTDTIHFTVTPVPPASCGPFSFTWDFGDGVPVAGDPTDGHVDHKFFGGLYDAITVSVSDKSNTVKVPAQALNIAATAGIGQLCPLNTLCVNDNVANPNKYRIALNAIGPNGPADGIPVIRNSGFGYFTLPTLDNPQNPQVFVKVVEIPGTNRRWVFYSGLTNLPYTISVTDPSGTVTRYPVAAASGLQSVGDFDVDGQHAPPCVPVTDTSATVAAAPGSCKNDPSALCLLNGRFKVNLVATTNSGAFSPSGPGSPLRGNDEFGFFTTPTLPVKPTDVQAFVKMKDATSTQFASYWVFFGGLTDFNLVVTVTDTQTGRQRTYNKPAGSTCGWNDTAAFSK